MPERDYSISFIRCIAMTCIVLCHIMQHYNLEMCWWFNVGVQIFFIISGWLYINKEFNSLKDLIKFYIKNSVKILVDYYIYISLVLLFFFFINKTPENFINLYKINGTVAGLGHLWFIKYILICYFVTPIFVKIIKYLKNNSLLIVAIAIMPIIISIISNPFHIIGAWINCFYIGMLLHSIKDSKYYCIILRLTFFIAVILNSVQIYLQYFLELNVRKSYYWHHLYEYAHVFLGITCFYILKFIYNKIKMSEFLKKFLDYSDVYSYDVYLTHHIYILGPLSLLNKTSCINTSLFKILIIILFSAYALNKISTYIKNIILKLFSL